VPSSSLSCAAPLLAAAAVVGLPAGAPASSFTPPRSTDLPGNGQTAVAVASDGGTAVAVRSFEGEGDRFRLRLRAAAGTLAGGLGPARTLLTTRAGSVRELQVVAAGGGGALVAWAQADGRPGGGERLRYAVRGAGEERFGRARTLAPVASATASNLRVAAGPGGTMLAVWREHGRLLWATARLGRFGSARLLTRDGVFPSVTSAGAGRWVVAWARGPQRRRIGVVAVLDGARTVRRGLGPVIASAFVPGLRVVGAPDGTALVAGLRRVARERYRGRPCLRQVAPALGREEPIGEARRTRVPVLAAGPGGRAVVAFLGVPEGARFATLLGALRPAGGPMAPVEVLSREEILEQPRVAWAAGQSLVGWIASRRARRFVVRVTVSGGAGRGPATTLGEAGAPRLQLAGSPAGALAAWPGPDGRLVVAAAPAD